MPCLRLGLAVRGVAVIGILLAITLWRLAAGSQGHPGCSSTGDCSVIWQSRWATWFGLPVSALALGPYLLLLVAAQMAVSVRYQDWGRKLVGGLSGFFPVVVIWFVVLQGLLLKHWCRLCLTSHAISILTAILGLLWLRALARKEGTPGWFPARTFVAGACLALAGVATHTLSAKQTDDVYFRPIMGEVVIKRRSPEVLEVFYHKVNLRAGDAAWIGAIDAPEVVVTLFDYTCPDCRRLHRLLPHILSSRPGHYLEVLIPAPLNPECNPAVKINNPLHADACKLARLGMIVAQNQPEQFAAFHAWMMSGSEPPSVEAARQRVEEIVGKDTLTASLQDSASLRPLKLGAAIFKTNLNEMGIDGIPVTYTSKAAIFGAPERLDDLLRYIP